MSPADEKRIRYNWTALVPDRDGGPPRRMITNHEVAVLLGEIERLRAIIAAQNRPILISTGAA